MTPLEALAVLAAGGIAGCVNAIVGSGSLLTFPVLLAVGYPAVTANVSNTVGLVFGNLSAIWGYRRELRGQRRRATWMVAAAALGAGGGAALLLLLPGETFRGIVPFLILLACALMALRPSPRLHRLAPGTRAAALAGLALFTGLYGGYFGAAAGVIALAAMRFLIDEPLQRLNGLKNLLVGTSNGVAALIFVFTAHLAVGAAALIAVGSIVGAQIGSRYGRRLPEGRLRAAVVVVGVAVAIVLLVT